MRLLVMVALATVVFALPPMFGGRRRGGFTSHLHENIAIDPSLLASHNTGTRYLTQKQDHFDPANTKTWKQQYFFNTEYQNDESRVNFLYISGEQSAALGQITGSSAYVYYAEMMNATLYSLEHRYYGESHPTEDTTTENLKYLSSRQAIEDIAEFIRQINEQKGGDQKWIVIGGSYAGALSAWSRLKHPELISGSIASSAPILAQLDFYGYLQTVDEDFKKIGGLCYSQLGDGIEEATRMFQTPEGRQNLSVLFRLHPRLSAFDDITDNDIGTFFKYVITPFFGSAQNNFPSMHDLCGTFTAHGPDYDPVKALAFVNPNLEMNINFTDSLIDLSGIDNDDRHLSDRLWLYQTCAEFGFFHSTDMGSGVFGQTQHSNAFIEYCEQIFGINVDQIQKNVESTNEYYGGRDYYAGTNVVFSHGTQDPWSFLTKKSDPKHWSVVIVEIEGGSHVSDLGLSCSISDDYCSPNMLQVQRLTLENMQRWIDPIFPVPDRVEITDNVGKRPQLFDPNVRPAEMSYSNSLKIRGKRAVKTPKSSKGIDFKKWNKFTGKGRKVLLPPPLSEKVRKSDDIEQGWIQQTWDHFDQNEERTFKQKWYSNRKFGSGDGPNFLMIGGEGPEDSSWLEYEDLAWMTYAKAVGANLFILEHRYYGESKLGTNDLQYLTSAQMLYDVATFIRTKQVKENLTGPWISFGGSYPGALAAWSREWFPELILGAVGSSGPVLAKNDFYEYLEVVEDVIHRQSQKCYDRTVEAFQSLHKLAQDPEGRATIQEKFVLWPEWTSDSNDTIDPLDMNEVFSALYGMYQGTVQYNPVDWSHVAALCSIMEDDKYADSVDALSALRTKTYGDDVLLSSYDLDIQYLIGLKELVDGHDDSVGDDELSGLLWTWQTCNEFGYYQTTDYGEGIFGTPVPVNFFIIMCERVFGVGIDHVEKGVARTNYQYGGRTRYNTTNVVLPNGDADPWHALSILEKGNMDESVVPIVIKGTSHCADMHAATVADPPELTQARKTILENIQRWLAPIPPSTTISPIRTTAELVKTEKTSKTETTRPISAATTKNTVVTTTTLIPTTSSTVISSALTATVILLASLIVYTA